MMYNINLVIVLICALANVSPAQANRDISRLEAKIDKLIAESKDLKERHSLMFDCYRLNPLEPWDVRQIEPGEIAPENRGVIIFEGCSGNND